LAYDIQDVLSRIGIISVLYRNKYNSEYHNDFGHSTIYGYNVNILRKSAVMFNKYIDYTQDIIEVFSHSFEMAIYPYLNYFFDSNNINKYRFSNINSHVGILLGCTLNDEVLEIVYSNESLLDADFMSKTYLDLRLKYGFEFSDEDAFYSKGKRWMTFGHFFSTPFYMIDYALAIIVAFQLYQQSLTNSEIYVQNFETLAKNIGNLSQKNISEYSSCFSAFDFDQFKKLAQFIEETLEQMKLS
jgi:oligoendopeptidase F